MLDGWMRSGAYGSSFTRPDPISALMSRSDRSTRATYPFRYDVWASTARLPPPGDQRADLDPLRWTLLHAADQAAYCAGVWGGVWRERRTGPLRPHLTGIPGLGEMSGRSGHGG